LPAQFNWPWFWVAFALMTAPVIQPLRDVWIARRIKSAILEMTGRP